MADNGVLVENALVKQIADLENRIRALEGEKRALERLLLKTRQDNVLGREVTRKNSVSRIMVENQIIQSLHLARKPMSNGELYKAAVAVLMAINESTFRSYLKRMKDANLIQNKGSGWILVERQ